MSTNLKITIGITYLISLSILLYFVFSFLDLTRLSDYSYIKENTKSLIEFKDNNTTSFVITFYLFVIVWILLLGFGSPISIVCGFIFGKWLGTLIVVIGLSIGATFLYIFGNYFLKDIVREKFLNRYQNLEKKFKVSEFYYMLIYRFIGGIPWQLSCILPTIFNVKIKNFFFASLIGIIPQIFLAVSIGSGLEKVIDENSEVPGIFDIIFTAEIYVPILAFFSLILISIFFRKRFYKG